MFNVKNRYRFRFNNSIEVKAKIFALFSFYNEFLAFVNKKFRSGYECPICGMKSSDSQEIFDDVYHHIYNKDNLENNDKK